MIDLVGNMYKMTVNLVHYVVSDVAPSQLDLLGRYV